MNCDYNNSKILEQEQLNNQTDNSQQLDMQAREL
jgi:hypothetical protein